MTTIKDIDDALSGHARLAYGRYSRALLAWQIARGDMATIYPDLPEMQPRPDEVTARRADLVEAATDLYRCTH